MQQKFETNNLSHLHTCLLHSAKHMLPFTSLHIFTFTHTCYILHATLCTLSHSHMTCFTFRVGDVVSLTSENPEIASVRLLSCLTFLFACVLVKNMQKQEMKNHKKKDQQHNKHHNEKHVESNIRGEVWGQVAT